MPTFNAEASRAASSAGASLFAACAGIAGFIPPLSETVLSTPLATVALSVGVAVAVLLHGVFVALTARALGRRGWPWVLAALLSFPIGSIVVLVLLDWQRGDGRSDSRSPASAQGSS